MEELGHKLMIFGLWLCVASFVIGGVLGAVYSTPAFFLGGLGVGILICFVAVTIFMLSAIFD